MCSWPTTVGFGTGTPVDAFLFLAFLESTAGGDKLLIQALSGPISAWDTVALPTDYSFLSLLPTHFSVVSLEVPGEGDENDQVLGTGSFTMSVPTTPVPEPASLTLTALGLAGAVARARRRRARRDP